MRLPAEKFRHTTAAQFLTAMLGDSDTLIWDAPTYRAMVGDQDMVCLEIPAPGSREQALDAIQSFLVDSRLSQSPLSGSEIDRIEEATLTALGGQTFPIQNMPEAELRRFVHGLCAGQVYTDLDAGSDVGSVFVVLSMMEPEPPIMAAVAATVPAVGPEPTKTNPPIPPPEYTPTAKPEEPKSVEPVFPLRESIQRDVDWGLSQQDKLDLYEQDCRQRAEAATQTARAAWGASVAAWAQRCDDLKAAHAKAAEEHKIATQQWESNNADFEAKHAAWEVARARDRVAFAAATGAYMSTLGCVWEYMSQAMPMAVNGKPMFFSLRYMSKPDWERARTAAAKEIERRKEIEI
jgi:hypothetical protein